jgi:hypothetical protein
MKYKITTLLLAAVACLAGCNEEEIPLYSGGNHLQFVKNILADSTTVAFLLYQGKAEVDAPVIVKTTGAGYPVETSYKISVDREHSTAIEGTHFRMPTTTSFKPGATRDTTAITFIRVPAMKTDAFRLVLRVEANGAFTPGQEEYRHFVFVVHDKIAPPDWWVAPTAFRIRDYYLGTYSDRKYEKFIEVTGVADLTGATPSELRVLSLQLKYWLDAYEAEHGEPYREENGDPMTVRVKG